MRTTRIWLGVAAVAALAGLSGCVTLGADVPVSLDRSVDAQPDYVGNELMPLQKGRTWVYAMKVFGFLPVHVTGKVVDVRRHGGTPVAEIAWKTDQPLASTEQMQFIARTGAGVGLYRTDVQAAVGAAGTGGELGASIAYDPPRPIGPDGHQEGDTWTVEYQQVEGIDPFTLNLPQLQGWGKVIANALLKSAQGGRQTSKLPARSTYRHLGTRSVTVPVGTFEAVVIESDHGLGQKLVDYFVPGIGLVKEEIFDKKDMSSPLSSMELTNTQPSLAETLLFDYGSYLKKLYAAVGG